MEFGPFLLLALMEGLVGAAVLALTASGLSLVFGVMRVVNVAHGEFFMLGAVAAWFVSQWVPGPPAVAFAVALVVCPLIVAALAALADLAILKRLKHEPEATIVATIGLLYILQQAALTVYGPEARPVPAPFEMRLQLPWFGWSGYKLFVIGAAAAVLLGLWLMLTRTRAGLVMRATQIDRETATAFGIDVTRVHAGTFALGAALAAVAAVLIVPIQQAHYLMGGDPLLLSFIVVIIGGLGSLRGTLLAALLIGLSDGVISTFFQPTLAKIVATLLVALVLVFRPQGLFGARA
ncbi:amino acid/amide ABC transporter membrane protein 1 (HAAT family) [Cereibacter ovatus]|uniref:Amino acid/amide ABC transporter membrane protein 1 (HAAT family) n=1 Tax=Cereibacter ovatus TaxID=439529 RepID=A0A285CZI2_9RHOB|nr:branched-chain amino acid ABC transporter permease [Cereibacter ovatus]SNX72478.1 amino acid/amide ABC transporter membrane protein 1 (HAAT family) [Cereibacter ovatus]